MIPLNLRVAIVSVSTYSGGVTVEMTVGMVLMNRAVVSNFIDFLYNSAYDMESIKIIEMCEISHWGPKLL